MGKTVRTSAAVRRAADLRQRSLRLEFLEKRWLLAADAFGGGTLDEHDFHEHDFHEFEISSAPLSGFGELETSSTRDSQTKAGPNLKLNSIHLRNGLGQQISAPLLGERVAVQANFTTEDLPAGSQYYVHFTVDGVTLSSSLITLGAGSTGVGSWFWWNSGWFATSGQHSVQVTVDPFNTVGENNEGDNTLSFNFTPVQATNLPQKLAWPIEGNPFEQMGFVNYVDLDPLGGTLDYRGGMHTYDRHDAWDIGPQNFQAQDEGIELYAAAAGTVIQVRDGEFDRQTSQGSAPANFVEIDHGNGWTTVYWHLRRDSVRVKQGDVVQAGDLLGYMGSSGSSTDVHIHFGLRHYGFTVEPMLDPATYLADASLRYVGDAPAAAISGVTNYDPGPHLREFPSNVENFEQRSGQNVNAWASFWGLRQGDVLQYVWRRPNGSVFTTTSRTMTQDYSWSWWWWGRTLPTVPDLGTWKIEHLVNGAKVSETAFEVTPAGAPEIRVEQSGGAIVLDGRYTPIDFGTVKQGASSPTQTFTVINHGDDPLSLGAIQVPRGFTVTEGLPASLAPGASNTFTVALSTSTAGYFGGRIHIANNDADEADYDFSVEGIVETLAANQALALGISERIVPEGRQLVANVRRVGTGVNLISSLTVTLQSDDTSEATGPVTVTIPPGARGVSFFLNSVNDGLADGPQTAEFMATASGFPPAYQSLRVTDAPTLTVSIVADSISESAGPAATTATVSRNTDTSLPLTVTLTSSDLSEASLPVTTVVIPAGQTTSAPFNIDAVGDSIMDGDITVQITAMASGFASGSDTLIVEDDDLTSPWQNPVDAMDVDDNNEIDVVDAVIVINELLTFGPRSLAGASGSPPPYLDIDGDLDLDVVDAVILINFLLGNPSPAPAAAPVERTVEVPNTSSANETAVDALFFEELYWAAFTEPVKKTAWRSL